MKYLYGFKNKETGLFKSGYKTIQGTSKPACFKTELNGIKTLAFQDYKEQYMVSKIVVVE